MKKALLYILAALCLLGMVGCAVPGPASAETRPADEASGPAPEETLSADAAVDYPAAIMVGGTVYLLQGEPMAGEVDDSAIFGHTTSYTDTFPEKDGETNFNRETDMPYAAVDGGIAVLYQNEWYLCTPKK